MKADDLEALACATLAHGMLQLSIHFPPALEQMQTEPAEVMEHAFELAERAIAIAPQLPDGYAALARVLLARDEEEATEDAIELLQRALALDPQHDAVEIDLATALRQQGDAARAAQHVENVIRRGNGYAQPLVLRALLHLDRGEVEPARRDLERAAMIAPKSGLVRLDAAKAAERAGDNDAAAFHERQSKVLLGDAFERIKSALLDEDSKRT